MPKLLILSTEAAEFRRLIEESALPDLEIATAADPESARGGRMDCEILYGEARMIREVLANLPQLKWVQTMSAGVDRLMDPSLRRDYTLTNSGGAFGTLMREYVMGYILAYERRVFERRDSQLKRIWNRDGVGHLNGKTIGILGVGSIGSEIAATAKHFGMHVRGYTRASETCAHVDAYYHGDALPEFAAGCDYVVSVLPKTAATHHMVDAAFLWALPSHAVFINVGRGATVDEAALIDALQGQRLALAVLDVFEQEPLPESHPLWSAPNLWMSFHTSASSRPEDLAKVFIENYARYFRGEKLKHEVSFELGY